MEVVRTAGEHVLDAEAQGTQVGPFSCFSGRQCDDRSRHFFPYTCSRFVIVGHLFCSLCENFVAVYPVATIAHFGPADV